MYDASGKELFAKPNDLLFTHIHEDHYDQALVDEFQQRYPGRIVYAPGLDKDNIQPVVLEHGIARMQIEEYEVYAFTTVHDGKIYEDEPHCSYLIRWEEPLDLGQWRCNPCTRACRRNTNIYGAGQCLESVCNGLSDQQ